MVSFLDKILNLMGVDEEDYMEEETFPRRVSEAPPPVRSKLTPKTTKGRLITFPANKTVARDGISKIVLCELSELDQIPEIVDSLRQEIPIVVNLRYAEPNLAQRLLDLLCGVVFALDGKIARIEEAIFLLTPPGVDIAADIDLLSLDPELNWLNK